MRSSLAAKKSFGMRGSLCAQGSMGGGGKLKGREYGRPFPQIEEVGESSLRGGKSRGKKAYAGRGACANGKLQGEVEKKKREGIDLYCPLGKATGGTHGFTPPQTATSTDGWGPDIKGEGGGYSNGGGRSKKRCYCPCQARKLRAWGLRRWASHEGDREYR